LNVEKESELISKLQSGDAHGFESLFNSYYQPLVGYARTIVKNGDEAEDIVQQVFVSIWEKRTIIEIHTSLKAMLYKAVYNTCLNKIKHETVRRNYSKEVLMTSSILFNNEEVQYKELQKKINSSIDGLPEQCAKIFKMSRFEYLKYQEIADRLNISVKTVENQMGKALKILRENMKEYLVVVLTIILNK
jgi:RNA polymerase sigma-70 factor (ECF subfamily)